MPNEFLTSVIDRSEWSASYSGHFTTMKKAPGIHWIGGWVDQGLSDCGGKEKIPACARGQSPVIQPITTLLTVILAHERLGTSLLKNLI